MEQGLLGKKMEDKYIFFLSFFSELKQNKVSMGFGGGNIGKMETTQMEIFEKKEDENWICTFTRNVMK